MKKNLQAWILSMSLMSMSATAASFNGIDFQQIGFAGNSSDASTGHGAVGYNYWIGRTEVTYAQFSASGVGNGNENYWASSLSNSNAPAVNVSWNEAARYCNWLTTGNASTGVYTVDGSGVVTGINRSYRNGSGMAFMLPTEDEWYKAAYFKSDGSGYTTYATGNTLPVAGVGGVNYSNAVGSAWICGTGITENNGTSDMNGNVWEQLDAAASGNVNLSDSTQSMLYRGGEYDHGYDSSFLTSAVTESGPANGRSYEATNLGLRIVAIPEPGTISLMSLSTIGLFLTRTMRRRRRLGQSLLPLRRARLCDSFRSEQEWQAVVEDRGEDYLLLLGHVIKQGVQNLRLGIDRSCKAFDKAFWNRMVVLHESRVALQSAFQKKALDRLDALLELIMK